MSFSLAFWVVFVLCFIFGMWSTASGQGPSWKPMGFPIAIFILLALLGWRVFGPILHQ